MMHEANERAQEAFHRALAAYTETGHWANPETDAYLNAERDVEWEEAKATFDRLQAEDHDMHRVFSVSVSGCADCCCDPESRGMDPEDFVLLINDWTPGELSEAYGR